MSSNGRHPGGWKSKQDNDLFARPGKKSPRPFSPDEGCFTIVVGMGMLLVSLAVWLLYYWYANPEFHPERQAKPVLSPRGGRPQSAPHGINP